MDDDQPQTALRFTLVTADSFRLLCQSEDAHEALWRLPSLGTLEWPGELEVDALVWVRDALFAPRAGSALQAWSYLRRGYEGVQWPHPRSLGCVRAGERAGFLAGASAAPTIRGGPHVALGASVDLDALAATFERVLAALRAAPPDEDLLLLSR
jgi:hypothetical protein